MKDDIIKKDIALHWEVADYRESRCIFILQLSQVKNTNLASRWNDAMVYQCTARTFTLCFPVLCSIE